MTSFIGEFFSFYRRSYRNVSLISYLLFGLTNSAGEKAMLNFFGKCNANLKTIKYDCF
jgi:hypothetical protein